MEVDNEIDNDQELLGVRLGLSFALQLEDNLGYYYYIHSQMHNYHHFHLNKIQSLIQNNIHYLQAAFLRHKEDKDY